MTAGRNLNGDESIWFRGTDRNRLAIQDGNPSWEVKVKKAKDKGALPVNLIGPS
jgi:hypothetical protein